MLICAGHKVNMHSVPSCKLPAVSCFHLCSCAWPSRPNGCCLQWSAHAVEAVTCSAHAVEAVTWHLTVTCSISHNNSQCLSQDMHASGSCKERNQTFPLLAAAWHALPQYRNNVTVLGHCHHSTMGSQCCITMLQHRPAILCF